MEARGFKNPYLQHSLMTRPTPPLRSPDRGAYQLGIHNVVPKVILEV